MTHTNQPSNLLTHGAHISISRHGIFLIAHFSAISVDLLTGSFCDGISNATFVLHILDFEASLLGSTMYHVHRTYTLSNEHVSISTSMCLRAFTRISSSFRLFFFLVFFPVGRLIFKQCQHSVQALEINVYKILALLYNFVYEFKKRLYHIRNASGTMRLLVNLKEQTHEIARRD